MTFLLYFILLGTEFEIQKISLVLIKLFFPSIYSQSRSSLKFFETESDSDQYLYNDFRVRERLTSFYQEFQLKKCGREYNKGG